MNKLFIIKLNAEDYLNYHLFNASQSAQVNSSRKRTVMMVAGIFILMAVISLIMDAPLWLPVFYGILVFLSFLLYPKYQSWIYRRQYSKFIQENYKNNIGKEIHLTFTAHCIEMKDDDSNSQIQYAFLQAINELPEAFYLKLKSSQSVIIPKNQVADLPETKSFLQDLATQYAIPYQEFPQWQWK